MVDATAPSYGRGIRRRAEQMQWILAILAIVVLVSVLSIIVTALKWLLIIAVVVAVVAGVRMAIGGSRRGQIRS
jgi:hypothetical protein